MANYSTQQYNLDEMIKKANYARIEMNNASQAHGTTSIQAKEARKEYGVIKHKLIESYGILHY